MKVKIAVLISLAVIASILLIPTSALVDVQESTYAKVVTIAPSNTNSTGYYKVRKDAKESSYAKVITVASSGADYTSLYDAIRDNYSGLTAETRILIKVKGEIIETQMIHAESYVDVIGDKDAVIIQRGTNVYGVVFDHPHTTWQNITVINEGTNVIGGPAAVIAGEKLPYAAGADHTTVIINSTFITDHTTNVTAQTAISIRDDTNPRLYYVVGIGGNSEAGYGHGILVTDTASPYLFHCTTIVRNAKAKAWLFLFDATPTVISGVAILQHPNSISLQLENNADPTIRGFKVIENYPSLPQDNP